MRTQLATRFTKFSRLATIVCFPQGFRMPQNPTLIKAFAYLENFGFLGPCLLLPRPSFKHAASPSHYSPRLNKRPLGLAFARINS